MRLFFRILFSVFITITLTGLFFLISLSLDQSAGFYAWYFVIILALSAIIFAIVGLSKPKKYLIKTRSTHILIIVSAVLLSISTLLIAFLNFTIHEINDYTNENSQNLTNQEKIQLYTELAQNITNSYEKQVENMDEQQVDHITFYYPKGKDYTEMIDILMNALNHSEATFKNLFANADDQVPVKVILYDHYLDLPMNSDLKPEQSGFNGQYNAGNKVISIPKRSNEITLTTFKINFLHEYSHHLMHSYSQQISSLDLPFWFDEGVASYAGSVIQGVNYIDNELELVKITDLKTQGQGHKYMEAPYNSYLQSQLFIGYLIEHEGKDVIDRLLNQTENTSFGEAFQSVTGYSVNTYGDEFLKQLKSVPDLMDQALELSRKQDWHMSLDMHDQVLSIVPNHILAHHRIGITYMEMGEYQKEKEYREAVIQLDPNDGYSYLFYTDTLLILGEIKEAINSFKKGISISEQNGTMTNREKDQLKHLIHLEEDIEKGEPLKGYLTYIKSDYVNSDRFKVDLIDLALAKYPHVESEAKYKLLQLKSKLEKQ